MLLRVATVAAMFAVAAPARADDAGSVALLPLDAEPRLEIYGQPVASEIARALAAGGIDVLVVGTNIGVPKEAKLVVYGSIRGGKGDAVTLTVGVRRPMEGKDDKPLEETAATLSTIDRAASRLAARVLPRVRERLAEVVSDPVLVPIPKQPPPPVPQLKMLLVGVTVASSSTAVVEPLRVALGTAVASWSKRWQLTSVEPSTLGAKLAPMTVTQAHAEHGVVLEVLDYSVKPGEVPLARARVRVRIANPGGVAFDRVVSTDTVVGDKQMPADALAGRVAREVISILRPHLRRVEPTW